MSSDKVKPERTKPGTHVGTKIGSTSASAKFIQYGNRAILCDLRIKRTKHDYNESWRFFRDIDHTGKARCHPGDEEKNIPADQFDQKVGMNLAFSRACKAFDSLINDVKKEAEYYAEIAKKGEETVKELEATKADLERDFARYCNTNLLICEERES